MMNTPKISRLLTIVLLICFSLVSLDLLAQKRILQTESDGFKWYLYEYEKKDGIYPKAAFDLNGKQLTPIGHGVNYWKGFFEVCTKNDANGRSVFAIYDKYGKCIVADKFGFTEIHIYPESDYEVIACRRSMEIEGDYLFSMDGKYYTKGTTGWNDKAEFNANKKPVSTLGGSYASGDSSNSSSSSSGTTTTTTVTPTPTPQPQPQPQPRPMQVWKPCPYCQGSGKCHVCLGDGHPLTNPTGTCIVCNGRGICSHCAGHGGQNVIEYH